MTEGSLLSRPSHLGTYDRLNRLSTKKTLTKEAGSCETNRDPTSACQCLNESEHPTSADLALPTQISCRSKLKVAKSLARGVLSPRPMPFADPRDGGLPSPHSRCSPRRARGMKTSRQGTSQKAFRNIGPITQPRMSQCAETTLRSARSETAPTQKPAP